MELNNVSGAYKSSAKIFETDDEKETKKAQEEEAVEEKVTDREKKDTVEIAQEDEFDETSIQEKANNYIANILANPKLTDESAELLRQYKTTFDAARFIKLYGPFTTTAEVSAAMYAVTSHMIGYEEE